MSDSSEPGPLRAKVREAPQRGGLAEVERRRLEAELDELRESTSARIAALEEEVAALLEPTRERALLLFTSRRADLAAAAARAEAHRRDLEGLFFRSTESDLARVRDAATLRAAIQREASLMAALAECDHKLAALTAATTIR